MKDGIWHLTIERADYYFSSRQTLEQSIEASHAHWEDKPVLVFNNDDNMIWENDSSYRIVAHRCQIIDKVVAYVNG